MRFHTGWSIHVSMNRKIALLHQDDFSSRVLFHSLKESYPIDLVIEEQPVKKTEIVKKRIKRLGYSKVFGQVLFYLLVVPFLELISKKRKQELITKFKFNNSKIEHENFHKVSSVNSEESRQLLVRYNPDLVIINGTRILSKKTLQSINAAFMNIHAGITPKYRGVHGGYWALAKGDGEHCGVTVHLVDMGIDTGDLLVQSKIKPTAKDNFATIPLLQLEKGIQGLKQAIATYMQEKPLKTKKAQGESKLWYHPTIWEYLWTWCKRGVS